MKRKIKRGIILISAAAFILTACHNTSPGSGEPEQQSDTGVENMTIGVTLAAESIYLTRVAAAMAEAAKEEGVELLLQYADWDVELQEQQIEDFIAADVGAIIMAPVNSKAVLTPLKKANNAAIPVINVNMKVDGISTEYIETYVGASSSEEGEKAAGLLIELLGEAGGKVGIVEGSPGSDPQIYRTQAFIDGIAHHPNIEVSGIGNGEWTRAKAKLVTIDLLRRSPDLQGIYCHDSEMAMGAIEALEEMDKLNQVQVVGIAEDEEYIQAVRDGKLAGIVTQPPEYEGKNSVYCAVRRMRGEKLLPWYKDPIEVLTAETIETFTQYE